MCLNFQPHRWNNFVAVIVFLMTVLLTDSIDFSSFTQASVSSNIVAVCGIFTLVSLLYMIVTVIAGKTKWGWLENAYNDLKDNYNGVLDERDIQMAVNNDAAFILSTEWICSKQIYSFRLHLLSFLDTKMCCRPLP